MHRPVRAVALLLAAVLVPGLAGCVSTRSEPTSTPATRTPTTPPVVTRIVPPPPTPTATPVPTLAFDIQDVLGSWMLRFTLDITGSTFVERLSYFGAARFDVSERGTISGSGYFRPTLHGGRCQTFDLTTEPLSFSIEGEVRPDGASRIAHLRLVPDRPDLPEAYRVICPDTFADVRERNGPLLWPALDAAGQLELALRLEGGDTATFQADLAAITTVFDGVLAGHVEIWAG